MKKGISLLSLMITLVIMALLATTVTISAKDSINNSRKISFATEISSLTEIVDNYYTLNGSLPIADEVEFDISTLSEENKQEFEEEDGEVILLYKLDKSKLNIDTVFGNEEKEYDFYAVSKTTNKVYYLAGVSDGTRKYYTLTDELKQIIEYDSNSLNDNIIFTKSVNKWSNESINLVVLVPTEYTDVTIYVQNTDASVFNVNDYILDGKYNKYSVTGVYGNYSVEVSYNKEGEEKTCSYQIYNFDDVAPSFKLSDKKVLDEYCYIEITDVKDDLSGVSKVKYLKENVSLEEVRDNGILVQNNMLEFEESTEYLTLYIEDNASNYVYQIIDVRGD